MKNFFVLFFSILDQEDLSQFKIYLVVVLLGSVLSVLGIGAVIPFVTVLMQPDKIIRMPFFHDWQYQHLIMLLTSVLVAAFAIKNTSALLIYRFQFNFLFGLIAKIQKKLFLGYMSHEYEYHLSKKTPNLIKTINNETNVLMINIVTPLGTILTEGFSLTASLIFLIILNPFFTSALLISLLVSIYFFMRLIRKKLKLYGEARANSWVKITENILIGLSGIRESKLYHCESYFTNRVAHETNILKKSMSYQGLYLQAPRLLIEFMCLFTVMLFVHVYIFLDHNLKDILLILSVFGVAAVQLLPSINRLTAAAVQIQYGMPSLTIISQELKLNEKKQVPTPFCNITKYDLNFNHQIELKNIFYRYPDGTEALKDVSILLLQGKKIGLVGVSGAGKTTLVDLIMGLYTPQQGTISLDRKILHTATDFLSFQTLFGYIPQTIQLFDQTIVENIAFGLNPKDIDMDYLWQCLGMAQLKDFVISLKNREYSFIGEGGIRLSGGQRQRLGIARALYRKPKILVMDEATSSLDSYTEKEITNIVLNLKNITVLTIAHRLTTIKNYDLIYVLDKSRVVSSGEYNQLLDNCKYFQKISLLEGKNEPVKNLQNMQISESISI